VRDAHASSSKGLDVGRAGLAAVRKPCAAAVPAYAGDVLREVGAKCVQAVLQVSLRAGLTREGLCLLQEQLAG
jgi:hypothetical protein